MATKLRSMVENNPKANIKSKVVEVLDNGDYIEPKNMSFKGMRFDTDKFEKLKSLALINRAKKNGGPTTLEAYFDKFMTDEINNKSDLLE